MHHFGTRYQCIYIRVQSYKKVKKNAISPADISARVDENCQCSQVTGIACACTTFFQFDENLNTCIPSSDSQKCTIFKLALELHFSHKMHLIPKMHIFTKNALLSLIKKDILKCSSNDDCNENASCVKNDYSQAGFQVDSKIPLDLYVNRTGLPVIGKQLKTIKR